MDAKQAQTKMTEILKSNGFSPVFLTAEEVEDGIGPRPGQNFIKDGMFWTDTEAMFDTKKAFLAVNPKNTLQQKQFDCYRNVKDWDYFIKKNGKEIEWQIKDI